MIKMRKSPVVTVFSWCVAVFLVSPILIAVAMSFTTSMSLRFPPSGFSLGWYESVLADPRWRARLPVSLSVAAISAMLSTTVGTMAAFAMVRSKIKGKNLITALFIAPLVVPVVVLGSGIFFVWAKGWSLGPLTFGGGLVGTIWGMVLAHSVLAIPYPFITVRSSLSRVDETLELAAKGLGAQPVKAFFTITLPLILPGVFSGMIFAFIASWDEVVIASFLSTSRMSTIPVEIFNQLRDALNPAAAAISTMLLAVSLLLMSLLTASRTRGNGNKKSKKTQKE